ncbi:uncharacterized protein LOC116342065 isoform X2 [Contarinia nasturtii]|uniref:uncharacterized protein LOC116342065 isoform X2 n=1 Tax=Contarinia nasturtii TaxID=265458 RepID=UPI0012D43794|nr:uncharacterized protein LOC116342065 isoform X2 [Contarinia nasturtii]
MSFFASLSTNTMNVQLEDMKFGLMPSPPPSTTPYTDPSTASTTPSSSTSNSRKNSCNNNTINMSINAMNATSDFNQWLHAMKMVARLPGGTPGEFRRKLWLALADRHLHTSGIDSTYKWQTKCLSNETWLDDDEELGIQIVKDLHRTGSSLFSGPNGNINQAKLKRVLLGYARWNPEVGYCQGFNMLGALILQVMERSEIESLKVMIYLIEGVLPMGYFSGSMHGLQADMAVFREILSTRLPKLSKHLQRLQGTIGDNSMDPPLINVFTMQWFLTLFCTCLPKSCVLRVWDLVLIEGSDILLRTALAIWATISERVMTIKSADEFYCKMGTLSGELLNGHLFDSNSLIQRIVDLGPIADLEKMREKHLFNVTPWKDRKGMKIFYSDDDSDDENWKILTGSRKTNATVNRNQIPDTRERIALDISLLKKQYSKIRARQRQGNLTNTTKQQTVNTTISNTKPSNINQYLIGRNAIVSSKKRHGPCGGQGAVPPARTALPMSVANKYQQKRLRNATIDNASTSTMKIRSDDNSNVQKTKTFARHRSESSSYSEDSDKGSDDELDNRISVGSSSSSTSLCDDDYGNASSMDGSPMKSRLHSSASDDSKMSMPKVTIGDDFEQTTYTRFDTTDTDYDGKNALKRDNSLECDKPKLEIHTNIDRENNDIHYAVSDDKAEKTKLDLLSLPQREQITSTSQLSPIADISNILSTSTISPLKTPTSYLLNSYPLCETSGTDDNQEDTSEIDFSINTGSSDKDFFKVNEDGVTNAYFERVNHVTTLSMDSKFPFSFIEDTPDPNLETRLSRSSQEEDDDEEDDMSSFKSEVRRLSDSFESSLISIDHANSDLTKSSITSNSNTNSDAILKMIEENSKILDRIMCKNAQTAAKNITSLDDDNEKCDENKTDTRNEPKPSINENKFDLSKDNDSPAAQRVHQKVPKVEITSEDDSTAEKKQCVDEEISPKKETKITDDDHVFKYGDLSDCISKYLVSTNEKSDKKTSSEEELIEHEEKLRRTDNLDLPKTLSLLTHSDGSSEDIKNLLKESLFDYSRSPSESLPLDSKLENDLETLLKMSAELLREGFPLGSPPYIENEEALTLEDEESTDACAVETSAITTQDVENDEKSDSNRNSPYLDADALQLEMESVAGDISATISSIKNTIKSIDSLCHQDDDRRSRDRTDKTLNDILKVVEKMDEEKDNRKIQEIKSDPNKSPALSTVFEHASRTDDIAEPHDSPRMVANSRISRDRSRMTSPRRRKDDDFGEYESRARRNKSPSSSILSQNRYSGDFSSKFRFDDISSGSDSGSKSKIGSPYKTNEKLEIRHTTVTATFYDRFLSQKYEQQHKMDRSPSSPIINKAYLNSLKATSSLTASYHGGDKYRRDSRSTSPIMSYSSQSRIDVNTKYMPTAPKSGYLHLPQLSFSSIHRDQCTRSCDNILSNLNATAEFTQKYSYQTKTSSDIFTSSSRSNISNIDTDNILKRHSTGTYYQHTSPLPIKPKKPSEIGIKLGLYKPE